MSVPEEYTIQRLTAQDAYNYDPLIIEPHFFNFDTLGSLAPIKRIQNKMFLDRYGVLWVSGGKGEENVFYPSDFNLPVARGIKDLRPYLPLIRMTTGESGTRERVYPSMDFLKALPFGAVLSKAKMDVLIKVEDQTNVHGFSFHSLRMDKNRNRRIYQPEQIADEDWFRFYLVRRYIGQGKGKSLINPDGVVRGKPKSGRAGWAFTPGREDRPIPKRLTVKTVMELYADLGGNECGRIIDIIAEKVLSRIFKRDNIPLKIDSIRVVDNMSPDDNGGAFVYTEFLLPDDNGSIKVDVYIPRRELFDGYGETVSYHEIITWTTKQFELEIINRIPETIRAYYMDKKKKAKAEALYGTQPGVTMGNRPSTTELHLLEPFHYVAKTPEDLATLKKGSVLVSVTGKVWALHNDGLWFTPTGERQFYLPEDLESFFPLAPFRNKYAYESYSYNDLLSLPKGSVLIAQYRGAIIKTGEAGTLDFMRITNREKVAPRVLKKLKAYAPRLTMRKLECRPGAIPKDVAEKRRKKREAQNTKARIAGRARWIRQKDLDTEVKLKGFVSPFAELPVDTGSDCGSLAYIAASIAFESLGQKVDMVETFGFAVPVTDQPRVQHNHGAGKKETVILPLRMRGVTSSLEITVRMSGLEEYSREHGGGNRGITYRDILGYFTKQFYDVVLADLYAMSR